MHIHDTIISHNVYKSEWSTVGGQISRESYLLSEF